MSETAKKTLPDRFQEQNDRFQGRISVFFYQYSSIFC